MLQKIFKLSMKNNPFQLDLKIYPFKSINNLITDMGAVYPHLRNSYPFKNQVKSFLNTQQYEELRGYNSGK